MALQSFKGKAVGACGVTVAGITNVTNFTDTEEYGNIARAKNCDGDVKAVFMSKGTYSSQVSGYTATIAAPALGGAITGVDGSQRIMSSTLEASNQDFAKVTVTGKGI
jgi:hypothetical protein